MKTKSFFLICLFIGITSKLFYAQPFEPADDTRSVISTFTFEFDLEVSCGGEVTDILHCIWTWKETDRFIDGNIIRGINHVIFADCKSINTGEVFRVNEHIKGFLPIDEFYNFTNGVERYNLVGNMGSRYIVNAKFTPQEYTIERTSCPGRKN
jgi:hypothetical protein